ncbi:MAG: Gfo/Idh/MocA family protein [Rhodospirillaceae bacterium]
MERKQIGVAVVGCGRIGTLRATMAAAHPGVRYLAVSDIDGDRARALAEKTGAQRWSADNSDVIGDHRVDAVIISTAELAHTEPVLAALALRKPVLVEKPLALDLATADRIIAAASVPDALHVGFSRRFKKRYLLAKEQLRRGRLGELTGATVRLFNTRSQAMQTLKRLPENSPVSGLTYYIDLLGWLFSNDPVVEVIARGKRGVLRAAGHNTTDLAHAILTCRSGAVIGISVSYALPKGYPALGHAARVELLGSEGIMLLDDDHTDRILYSDHGVGHVYIPGHEVNMAFMGSGTPGDWALDQFWGPVATETRNWLDHLTAEQQCLLATPADARRALEVALAMERSLESGAAVRLSPVTEAA